MRRHFEFGIADWPMDLQKAALLAGLLLNLAAVGPAAAQDVVPGQVLAPNVCGIAASTAGGGEAQDVHAQCWGTGVVLGAADSFQSAVNFELQATVVELVLEGRTRVLLLRPDASGHPLMEDLGASLAVSVGRVAWASVADLHVDLSRFASEGALIIANSGTVGASPVIEAEAAEVNAGGPDEAITQPTVNIAEHIGRDVMRASAANAIIQ